MKPLVQAWYQGSSWLALLKPLSALFRWQAVKRRAAYQRGDKVAWRAPVPVVVVGNITVGGVGKTPLVAGLVEALAEEGYKPGIVSRGYGAKAPHYPFSVTAESDAGQSGDEPLLLAQRTGCPVVIDPDRASAAQYLLHQFDCNVIVSDDGLQHYALARDIEIAVIDGQRGLGNGLCLPAGPLREPPARLESVDFVVVNGEGFKQQPDVCHMQLKPEQLINLKSGERLPADALTAADFVHAVAGIGNPGRFFNALKTLGYKVQPHEFDDHYRFTAADIRFDDQLAVIMTEKDAVKCHAIAHDNCWYLRVNAQLDCDFISELVAKLGKINHQER